MWHAMGTTSLTTGDIDIEITSLCFHEHSADRPMTVLAYPENTKDHVAVLSSVQVRSVKIAVAFNKISNVANACG